MRSAQTLGLVTILTAALAQQPPIDIKPRIKGPVAPATETSIDRKANIRVDTTLVLIPVTVTDPRMKRYFLSIPEAVQLIIRAGSLSEGSGEVFVLEMGEPIAIIDLAKTMIRLSGLEPERDIAIEIVGARPGPVLALIAGNHGYEYPPILALQQLRSQIDPASLAGTVILLPLIIGYFVLVHWLFAGKVREGEGYH